MRHTKWIYVAVVLFAVFLLMRPRERMCAAPATSTASAIRQACADQGSEYDADSNSCKCPNGTT